MDNQIALVFVRHKIVNNTSTKADAFILFSNVICVMLHHFNAAVINKKILHE